jgi:nucleotide-binding universal stress UspA family protein
MNAPENAVVVCVAEGGVDSALAFAVGEAQRTQRPLHVAHVILMPTGTAYAGLRGSILEAGQTALDTAQKRAGELAGDTVSVTADLIDDSTVVNGLVRHTEEASVLVLQHRASNPVARVLTGSVAQSVAGRAHVPVVSVPEGWTPRRDSTPVVTAAVQDVVEAPALLRIAFEEARARSASLVVLHAWWLASGFDVVVVDEDYRDQYAAEQREELEPVLTPLRAEFPDVTVALDVRHAPPVEAVLDGAEKSDLLVLCLRHHLLPLRSHLGPVARAAISHAACPVLITPEPVAAAEPQLSDRLAAIARESANR